MTVRERKGKRGSRWIVEYRDETDRRRYKTFLTRDEAERFEAEKRLDPGGDPSVKVSELVETWLELSSAKVRRQTLVHYERIARLHILPTIGAKTAASIRPSHLERLLARKLNDGLAPKSVSQIQIALSGIFRRAVRDGLIRSNPADGLARELGLRRTVREGQAETVKAMTSSEVETFLDASRELYPHLYPMFYTMVSTGIRPGEARALRWPDVDFEGQDRDGERVYSIHVCRTMEARGTTGKTKNARSRDVDVDEELRALLWEHHRWHQAENLASGRTLQDWAFQRPGGGIIWTGTLREQFRLILASAKLPLHFTPHCLRHTFASLHIQLGTDLTYVSEQLGHSSIQVTYDVYGHWLNKSSPTAARRLQSALGRGKKKKSGL